MLEGLTHPYPWWLLFLAALGIFAAITVVVNLFFEIGQRPIKLWATHVPSVDAPDDFLLALGGAVNAPTRGGGTAELLHNGDAFFPAILEAIQGAERSITFFTYIFAGTIGDRVLDALTERARAGVQVRLMLDGFGASDANLHKLDELTDAGGKIHWYRPFHLGKLTRFHKRNHRRAIVVDGRIGFTGGASVGDQWLGNAQDPEHWRDDMFRVTGPLALSLQAAFGEAWANSQGELLTGPDFYPLEPQSDEGGIHVARHINLISSPAKDSHPLRKLFWLSFMAARQKLYLTSSYFVPDKHIRAALKNRAHAGVDVRILVPNEYTDVKPVRWAGQSYYTELLRAGVRIYEYQPTFIHSKTLVVDGKWSVVGSANMDIRSKELNRENVLGILDPGFGAQVERTFLSDLEHSREIRLEEWRRRGTVQRLLERFFVLFAEQY